MAQSERQDALWNQDLFVGNDFSQQGQIDPLQRFLVSAHYHLFLLIIHIFIRTNLRPINTRPGACKPPSTYDLLMEIH